MEIKIPQHQIQVCTLLQTKNLFVMVIFLSYNALLYASLTVSTTRSRYNDIHELLSDEKVHLFAPKSMHKFLPTGTNLAIKIWKRMKKSEIIKENEEKIKLLSHDNNAIIHGYERLLYDFGTKCEFTIIKIPISSATYFRFPKGSKYLDTFNQKLLKLMESGILGKIPTGSNLAIQILKRMKKSEIVGKKEEKIKLLSRDNNALIQIYEHLLYNFRTKCEFTIIKIPISTATYFRFPKGSKYLDTFNQKLLKLMESGILGKIVEDKKQKKHCKQTDYNNVKAISFRHTVTAFLILVVGVLCPPSSPAVQSDEINN
uniref:Uncharacterized protein n=1 Tax=Strigamia maritima TaxID=126957 RepID=T1IWZ5_STRMM